MDEYCASQHRRGASRSQSEGGRARGAREWRGWGSWHLLGTEFQCYKVKSVLDDGGLNSYYWTTHVKMVRVVTFMSCIYQYLNKANQSETLSAAWQKSPGHVSLGAWKSPPSDSRPRPGRTRCSGALERAIQLGPRLGWLEGAPWMRKGGQGRAAPSLGIQAEVSRGITR